MMTTGAAAPLRILVVEAPASPGLVRGALGEDPALILTGVAHSGAAALEAGAVAILPCGERLGSGGRGVGQKLRQWRR